MGRENEDMASGELPGDEKTCASSAQTPRAVFYGRANAQGWDGANVIARQYDLYIRALNGRAKVTRTYYEISRRESYPSWLIKHVYEFGGPIRRDGGWDAHADALADPNRGFGDSSPRKPARGLLGHPDRRRRRRAAVATGAGTSSTGGDRVGRPEAIRGWAGPRRVDRTHPLAGPVTCEEPVIIRVAFAGRTSTDDQQDPTLSLPRQLRTCEHALPEQAVIVAHFYDIESGGMDLAARGRGHAHGMFETIPRDGGIHDLLEEAERPDRRFDIVICEDISRIGPRSYISSEVERRLQRAGVLLIAPDGPFQLEPSGRRTKTATQVLKLRLPPGAYRRVLEILFEPHADDQAA